MSKIRIAELADILLCAAPKRISSRAKYDDYPAFVENSRASIDRLNRQREQPPVGNSYSPLISVIVACDDSEKTKLNATVVSIVAQTYSKWELIIATDLGSELKLPEVQRMRVVQLNGTNTERLISAESEANGKFLMQLYPGDRLEPDALFTMVSQFQADAATDMVYADCDSIDESGNRNYPFLKPKYSPEGQLCYDFVSRPLLVKSSVHFDAGGYGGGDYHDYVLRIAGLSNKKTHIARVLLTASGCVCTNHGYVRSLERRGFDVSDGLFDSSFKLHIPIRRRASVEIIIPNPTDVRMLKRCIESIDAIATFENYRLTISAALSSETVPELNTYLDALKRNKAARILRSKVSKANTPMLANDGSASSSADYLIFVSPNAEVLSPDFVEQLIGPLSLKGVSACGGKLFAPNGSLYSCGTVVGLGGWAGSPYFNTADDMRDVTKCCFTSVMRNVTAVEGAFMAVRSDDFASAGLFDETFTDIGWDTELCIRLAHRQKRTVFTPYAKARLNAFPMNYCDATKNNLIRCYDAFRDMLKNGDPFYNPNYDYNKFIPDISVNPAPAIEINPLYT